MWSKNIHEAKRARMRHPYVFPKGVMLILVVISMVLLYAEEPHQEEIKAVIRPGHQEYSKIKTLTLEEHFPGDNQMMQIDFNENTVMYGTINSPELRSEEHFSEEEERELILLLEKYRFLEWVIVSDTYFEDKYGIMGEGKEGEPEYNSDRYQVASWHEPEYYQNQPEPCRIKEGEFFNLIPDVVYDGLSEQEIEIRSTFETFIYLYDKEGRRLRLHYDNTGLPDNYNEFRNELWDFAMEYMAGHKEYLHIYDYYKEPDWRTLLDQWGMDHLEIMRKKSEESRGGVGLGFSIRRYHG